VQRLLIIKVLGMCKYPLDATLMGWTPYKAQRPKMVAQHQDRFWVSNCFYDSHLFWMNLDIELFPLEMLSPCLSMESKNAPIGFRT
jgi:hypothetical protein